MFLGRGAGVGAGAGSVPLPSIRVVYLIVFFCANSFINLKSIYSIDNFYWLSQQSNFILNDILRTLFLKGSSHKEDFSDT